MSDVAGIYSPRGQSRDPRRRRYIVGFNAGLEFSRQGSPNDHHQLADMLTTGWRRNTYQMGHVTANSNSHGSTQDGWEDMPTGEPPNLHPLTKSSAHMGHSRFVEPGNACFRACAGSEAERRHNSAYERWLCYTSSRHIRQEVSHSESRCPSVAFFGPRPCQSYLQRVLDGLGYWTTARDAGQNDNDGRAPGEEG